MTDPAAKDDLWTQNQMNLPVGRPVIVLLSSKDVVHSFGLPQMRVKQDAIPGVMHRLWFEIQPDKAGIYRGQCTELCGRDHGFMPIVVEAMSEADYAAWLASKKSAAADAAAPPVAATDAAATPAVAN